MHETGLRGEVSKVLEKLRERDSLKGEITLVIAAYHPAVFTDKELEEKSISPRKIA